MEMFVLVITLLSNLVYPKVAPVFVETNLGYHV